MRRLLPLMLTTCILCMLSCASSHGGIYPFPVRVLNSVEVLLPQGSLAAGAIVDFVATWQDGREPFQVNWNLDGGSDPALFTASINERMHTMDVELVNDTAGDVQYNGTVTITDVHSRVVSAEYSYTVTPAP